MDRIQVDHCRNPPPGDHNRTPSIIACSRARVSVRTITKQDGNASIERVVSFCLLSERVRGGGDSNSSRRQGRHDVVYGHGGDDGDDEADEVLQDARDKLREGLRLGGTATVEQKLSPRRLFQYLDSDGVGEVRSAEERCQLMPGWTAC